MTDAFILPWTVITSMYKNTSQKYYVTMTDKSMSGWGMAANKINKLVFECENFEEAERVKAKAETRREMKYINITDKKPYYNQDRYLTSFKTKVEAGSWYN